MSELSARAIGAAQAAVERELRKALDDAGMDVQFDVEWVEDTAREITTAAVMAAELADDRGV